MFTFIKKLLQPHNIATVTTETQKMKNQSMINQEIITQDFPTFDFSHFHNHTMIDVIITPASKDNNTIKLSVPKDMLDLIDLEMKDNFHIRFKSNSTIIVSGKNNPKIEIPANHLKSINNSSMGSLTVAKGIEVQEKIINEGSGNIYIDCFTGTNIKNNSMGKISFKTINTQKLKVSSDGSGNVEILSGIIDTLESNTNSMGKVTIQATIDCAKVTANGSGNTDIGHISTSLDIKLTSMGSITITGKATDNVTAYSSGSGKLVINNIDTKTLDGDLSSMGNVEIKGHSLSSKLRSSGSGTIKGDFSSEDFKINMSSMGSITVEPLKLLTVKINGMGNLNLSGEHILDNVEAHLSSMGKVKGGDVKTHLLTLSGRTEHCDIKLITPSKKNRM